MTEAITALADALAAEVTGIVFGLMREANMDFVAQGTGQHFSTGAVTGK